MTTSNDSGSASNYSSGSAAPTLGSDDQQVWNPSVGIYVKTKANRRESYGGIVAALQDVEARRGQTVKAYPENFAGIIAAIQDLQAGEYKPGSDVGDQPPGGSVIINPITLLPEWIEGDTQEGQLWFDTRQGRLFVFVDDEWWQTNGADGIPIITENATAPSVENVVPGQFWWDRGHNALYIFDGTYVLADDSITTNPNAGGSPVWKLVVDAEGGAGDGALQTTATLPLAVVGPRVTALEDYEYLPDPGLSEGLMTVQKDYNEWVFQALLNLDVGLEQFQPVLIGDTAPPTDDPDNPITAGQLWYDTESLELSIWYEDDDSGQWVPTSVSYKYDDDLATLRKQLESESRIREVAVHGLQVQLAEINQSDADEVADLQSRLNALQVQISEIPEIDLAPYATRYSLTQLEEKVTELEDAAPDYALLMSRSEIEAELDAIKLEQQDLATADALNELEASIPDVSSFVTQAEIDTSIAGITVEYLPRNGGTLTGSFVVQKEDYALPGFDFSTASWHSKSAFKLIAQGTGAAPTSFGTTDKPWEIAWEFSGHEDFCWNHAESGKQLSVGKDGVACKNLMIADFAANSDQGRTIFNTIDVKDRLQRYQSAFEHLRQGVFEATDFDTLKTNIITALANV